MGNAQPEILVLVGSPHVNGRSTQLAQAVAEELRARDAQVTYYHLAEYPVAACTNCGACSTTGNCAIVGDGWDVLSWHLKTCDALVLVAPVYFAGPSGWLKAAIDRCQMFWARKYVLGQGVPQKRPAHLLVVGDGGDPFGTQPLEAICTSALNCANLRIDDNIHRLIGDEGFDLGRVPQLVQGVLESIA